FAATVLLTQESLAAGFSQGNDFHVNRIRGNLSLYCRNPASGYVETHHVFCVADLWSPGLTDYFVGPQVNASKVKLTSTREDGSEKKKDGDYDGAAGKSKKKFNLGIHTLSQKPLLKEGINNIHFDLSENDTTVAEGNFTATVTRGDDLQCPSASKWGYGNDCRFTQAACDSYFEQFDYCQK
ncbi:MAG: hypothetical protein ACAH59_00800, partial [Pseudobdellovibrionaceae bacterium]